MIKDTLQYDPDNINHLYVGRAYADEAALKTFSETNRFVFDCTLDNDLAIKDLFSSLSGHEFENAAFVVMPSGKIEKFTEGDDFEVWIREKYNSLYNNSKPE
jgi:hypothetical protein